MQWEQLITNEEDDSDEHKPTCNNGLITIIGIALLVVLLSPVGVFLLGALFMYLLLKDN